LGIFVPLQPTKIPASSIKTYEKIKPRYLNVPQPPRDNPEPKRGKELRERDGNNLSIPEQGKKKNRVYRI
jgi:hypothetical protein